MAAAMRGVAPAAAASLGGEGVQGEGEQRVRRLCISEPEPTAGTSPPRLGDLCDFPPHWETTRGAARDRAWGLPWGCQRSKR